VKRTVCVVTGTRAEYGLLRWVMQGIADAPQLTLQIVATGMHLSPEFGLTYREIERDGFHIDRKVEMLLSSDSSVGIGKSIGLGTIGFTDALSELRPDVLVVLGDRFEILAAVSAALAARIPVAHLHGGEATEGVIDEAIRHAVTKMSHLHFVAAEEYRRRVIQLGEAPERVYLVGGLGIDNIRRLQLLERAELEKALDFELGRKNLLVTFHPATLDTDAAAEQMGELLAALEALEETHLIFTLPNADMGSRELISVIEEFVSRHPRARAYTSLGQLRYLSVIRHVDGVVGNSSSGIIEAPALRKGTIDIGDRQRGRLKASSVIESAPERTAITAALRRLYSADFQESLSRVSSPYGDGGASDKVVEVLATAPLDGILKKRFHDA
jgi:GDP/UDP-N,N'-diacetylbacillosamine 2-epimerase (hydrolysing)